MKDAEDAPSCSWCGLKVREHITPRCRKCNLVLCSPMLRTCAWDHWLARHAAGRRPIAEIQTRGAV